MKDYRGEIEREAYLLWERAGKPDGKADFFWHLAKDRVRLRKRQHELEEEVEDERRRGFLRGLGVLP